MKKFFKFVLVFLLFIVISGTLHSCSNSELETKNITIGIVRDPVEYESLKNYLTQSFSGLEVNIDTTTDSKDAQDSRQRIQYQQWDVVFSYTPMLSVVALDNGYTWVARMFPELPPYYQASLFVTKDSKVKSLSDINADTRVILGSFASTTTFYVPAYDLYGKTMNVSIDNGRKEIEEKLLSGDGDVGAGIYESIIKNNEFKVIHRSKNITGAGVFISPKLSKNDQKILKQKLLSAPEEIRKEANYGESEPHDYKTFRDIISRTEEVIQCADFTVQPVKFYCPEPKPEPITIAGSVNGITIFSENEIRLNLQTDTENYQIFIPADILSEITQGKNVFDLQELQVEVINADYTNRNDIKKIIITKNEQFKISNS